jgi:hypothetical protein
MTEVFLEAPAFIAVMSEPRCVYSVSRSLILKRYPYANAFQALPTKELAVFTLV